MAIPKLSFLWQVLLAIFIGVFLGLLLGERTALLAELAKAILQTIKALATPLLFFAILDAILSSQFQARGFLRLLGVCSINSIAAVSIGLMTSWFFAAGKAMPQLAVSGEKPSGDWLSLLQGYVPESVLGPFVKNHIPSIIVLAICIGFAMRSVGAEGAIWEDRFERIRGHIHFFYQTTLRLIGWVVKLAPVAILGSIAHVVATHGFSAAKGLGLYLLACLAGMILHILLVYQGWIRLYARRSLQQFWRHALSPASYAFGVNSSLATLPATLEALARVGVSPGSSRLAACVGTNFNNDGILLYEVMAGLFVAQMVGWDLSLWQSLQLAAVSVIATVGVAGIPEAGIISLTLVLSTMGLPAEAIPLVLTVDWLLGRSRSVVNVLGDMAVAVAIDGRRPLAEHRP